MVQIKEKASTLVQIASVAPGDIVRYQQGYYVKKTQPELPHCSDCYVVQIGTGSARSLGPKTLVESLSITLVVE